MPKPTKIVIDCSTGIEEIIELTDAEIAERTYQAELYAEQEAERAAQAEVTATAKAALLEKLGITADEAKLLLA